MPTAAALLFAVHPMMTEAVGYISGRSELLVALFFLLAFAAGQRWLETGGGRWLAAMVILWLPALASKETAAMFPFVLLAYDWLAYRVPRRRWPVYSAMLAVVAVGGAARFLLLSREYSALSFHPRFVLLELDVIRRYVQLIVLPGGQSIFHSVPLPGVDARGALAVGAGVLIVAVIWVCRRRAWPVSFGLLWFVLVLAPGAALAFFDQGEPMAEHRVYLASCGMWLAAGYGVQRVWTAVQSHGNTAIRRLAAAAAVLLVAALGAETLIRNSVWSDPIALWRESVDLAPQHYWPRLLLGEALEDAGRRREAVEQYQQSIRLNPASATGHVKLGNALVQEIRFDEARREFQKAIDVDPNDESARRALGALDTMEQRFGNDRGR
jgi:hypothetical protein